ncbi:bifunctional folylpolyglutamate synthase/dihydrofolate synthase [Geminicoccus harenae]|uniref:bifunctional folylpolyglutamate synthase/dihydrofolate synthase n=2 Tax=Geminicoccus harenae TaxID=2498453 RepID=UPI002AC3108D|nr:folylpolyglutamate synthase/dihydrofolate synthase family protein [Geminicoccus harenae]
MSRSRASDVVLARLLDLHPKKIDLSLARMERILAELGHPERALPPVVHLAGTNGKGSTGAYVAAALAASGRRVHRYVSPHLVRFSERILLSGEPIDEALLTDLLEEVERVNAGRPITFFEITTAMAFLAFARTPADLLVLEVGMGGRLDATNVIDRPAVSVITPVSLDHESYLGDTVGQIATEKAGILKPGVPCVLAPQSAEGLTAIERVAAATGTPLVIHDRDWRYELRDGQLCVHDGEARIELPRPALEGPHQYVNAAVAALALRRLPEPLRPATSHIARGLASVRWPGRWQRLTSGPMAELLPDGWELRLDGGHNPAAAAALAAMLDALPPGRPVHLVVGMLNTKDADAFLAPLLPRAASCTMVPIPDEPLARAPDELAATAARLGHPARTAPGHVAAVAEIVGAAPDSAALVLVCGSLHLAGSVLAEHG